MCLTTFGDRFDSNRVVSGPLRGPQPSPSRRFARRVLVLLLVCAGLGSVAAPAGATSASACDCDRANFVSSADLAHCWDFSGQHCFARINIVLLETGPLENERVVQETIWNNCGSSTPTTFSQTQSIQTQSRVCLSVGSNRGAQIQVGIPGWSVQGGSESSSGRQVCSTVTSAISAQISQTVPAGVLRVARISAFDQQKRYRVTTTVGWYSKWRYVGGTGCPELAPDHVEEHFKVCYRTIVEQSQTIEVRSLSVEDTPCP